MDRRLLQLYDLELKHVRGMSAEFRSKQKQTADRLGIDERGCADPYVERLIEAFAFLTARVQLQLAKEFPRFTQNLLELVYPGALTPTPSMIVVQLVPDFGQPLANGHLIKRKTELRANLTGGNRCDFRTVHDLTLWPVELIDASYMSIPPAVTGQELRAKSALKLRLRARQPFSNLALDRLAVYLPEDSETAGRTYEVLMSSAVGLAVRAAGNGAANATFKLASVGTRRSPIVAPIGFEPGESAFLCDDPEHAALTTPRRFQGYRLLQEYFAFPRRFMFVELRNLQQASKLCPGATEIELLVLLDPLSPGQSVARLLEGAVTRKSFELHCTPAVNLFRKKADPIVLREGAHEHLVQADSARPSAYEVHSIVDVAGRLARGGGSVRFSPLYALGPATDAQYTVERKAWQPPAGRNRPPHGGDYIGSDVYLCLSNDGTVPAQDELRYLELDLWCTNRGLPLSVNRKSTKFSCQTDQTVAQVVCMTDPTRPREVPLEGELSWQLISQLALNHHALLDDEDGGGLPALKRLLEIYAARDPRDHTARQRIEALHDLKSRKTIRPLDEGSSTDPLCYGRGIEVTLTCEETAYRDDGGVYLFGAVLERFLARYASINSFTETVLSTYTRGEVMRWPTRTGQRPLL